MQNAKKKARSNSKPENRHLVYCKDCEVTFPSYSLTVENALRCHKDNKHACQRNNLKNKHVVQDNFMDHDDFIGCDDTPDDFIDGATSQSIVENEEEINESSVRDPTNTRNTRSSHRAAAAEQEEEKKLRDDGREDEDENLLVEIEKQAKLDGARIEERS